MQLRDQDELRLQFLGANKAWLGCPYSTCDLRMCPSIHGDHFSKLCGGEHFQIIGEGTRGSSIMSGQRIRLRSLHNNTNNFWMGCPSNTHCDKRTCPGTTAQLGNNFNNNRCSGEIFRIYARGRTNGQIIYNGDVVMLYFVRGDKYIYIQGQSEGDDTSLNFCPGAVPPAYLSYGICSKNAFRVYRKP